VPTDDFLFISTVLKLFGAMHQYLRKNIAMRKFIEIIRFFKNSWGAVEGGGEAPRGKQGVL